MRQRATSHAALSRFHAWWQVRQQKQLTDETHQTLREVLSSESPPADETQLLQHGQRVLQLKSVIHEDVKSWTQLQQISLKRSQLALHEARQRLAEQKYADSLTRLSELGLRKVLMSMKTNRQALELMRQALETFKGVPVTLDDLDDFSFV